MTLSYLDTGVMYTLGQSQLEHLSLKTSLKEILHPKTQNVIKLHFSLIQDAYAHKSSQQSVTYEQNVVNFHAYSKRRMSCY